jgi:hypothetical protein
MSRQNVEHVRAGYEQFARRKTFVSELAAPDFAWDMSHFHDSNVEEALKAVGLA